MMNIHINNKSFNEIGKFIKLLVRHTHFGKICVNPSVSLVTDRVSIRGCEFEPLTPITIKATAKCESEKLSFVSFGHFITAEDGSFDLSSTKSVGGSYSGIDDMGLFWSMKETEKYMNRLQMNNASTMLDYKFSVFAGHIEKIDYAYDVICKASVKRSFMANCVKRQVVREEGVQGTMFTPPGKGPFPAIITLYGAMKRKQIVEDAAAILANKGFVTLALAFYGYESLPKGFLGGDVTVETFEKAIRYLLSHNYVNSEAIGVYGISKGAEIALAMTSFLPQIKAVVWINGCIASLGSTTSYQDHTFTDLGYDASKAKFLSDGSVKVRDCINDLETSQSSIFPFEYSSADLLFVVSLDDLAVCSDIHADFAKKKMDAVNKTNYEIIKYPGMGHLIDAPFTPPCSVSLSLWSSAGIPFNYGGGGDKRIHFMQQLKVWCKVVSFFNNSLMK